MRAQGSTKVGVRRLRLVAPCVVIAITLGGSGAGAAGRSAPGTSGAADCVVGTTGRIAFMLKQQTAFRYLNADMPFFKKTAEAAGYEVLVQSAENDAQTSRPGRERHHPGRRRHRHPAGRLQCRRPDRRDGDQGRHPARLLRRPDPRRRAGRLYRPRPQGRAAPRPPRDVVAKVPKGNYVLIGGDPGQTGSTLMQEGYHEVLDPLVDEGRHQDRHGSVHAGWKTEPAQANAENALTAERQQGRRLPRLL